MTVDAKPLLQPGVAHCCSKDSAEDLRPVSSPPSIVPQLDHVGSATLRVAKSNLVLAVLGAGQLTLPYAMGQLGLGFGMLALLIFGAFSILSLHTLSIYEIHFTPGPTDCLESFAELVIRVLGRFGSFVCSALLALYAWGGAVSFMVILKGELNWIAGRAGLELPGGSAGALLLIALSAAFLCPMSSLEDLSGLKRFSFLGCTAALFITVVASLCWLGLPDGFQLPSLDSACSGPDGSEEDHGELRWWPEDFRSVAACLPLFAFALNSSWAYIPILCTLHDKTQSRVGQLIGGSNLIILANYSLLSVAGYWMYCGRSQPNILDSLGASVDRVGPIQGGLIMFARFALTLQLTLALPMRFFVARRTCNPNAKGALGRLATSAALVGSAVALAISPVSLATVLGVTSSVCASMIIYILPATIDLALRLEHGGPVHRALRLFGSAVSWCVGAFVLVGGLWGNLTGAAVAGG